MPATNTKPNMEPVSLVFVFMAGITIERPLFLNLKLETPRLFTYSFVYWIILHISYFHVINRKLFTKNWPIQISYGLRVCIQKVWFPLIWNGSHHTFVQRLSFYRFTRKFYLDATSNDGCWPLGNRFFISV